MRSSRLAIVAMFLMAGRALAQTNSCTGTWSKPVLLTRDGRKPVYIERGIVAELGGRALAIGAPTLFWLTPDEPIPPTWAKLDTASLRAAVDSAGALWSLSRAGAFIASTGISTGIPMVDTATVRVSPRLFARTTTSLVVIWEAADSAARDKSMNATRIETSKFDGTRWSQTDVALRADHLSLGPLPAVGRAVFDLATFAAQSADSGQPHMHVVRRRGTRWVDLLVPQVGFAGFFGAYSPDENRTTLVAMGAAVPGRSGLYAFTGRWNGDTVTWSKPIMMDTLSGGYNPFSWARLGGDSIAVIWFQRDSTERAGALRTSISPDGGGTWKNLAPLESRSVIDAPNLVVDAAGRLHLIYHGAQSPDLNAPGAVLHSLLIGGRWTTPDFVSEEGIGPVAGIAPRGQLMASWGAIIDTPLGPSPKSLASFWSQNCARR